MLLSLAGSIAFALPVVVLWDGGASASRSNGRSAGLIKRLDSWS